MKLGLVASGFLAFSLLGSSQAVASTAVYTITGTGSGSLNGISFTDSAFTFTLTGDTANLSSGTIDPLNSALVTIAGLGSTTIGIQTELGTTPDGSVTFLSRSGSDLDLFDFFNSSTVDLGVSFGPITGTNIFALNQFQNVASSAGSLTFNTSSSVQFSGVVGAAAPLPEPGTWALMLLGFGAVGVSIRRARKSVSIATA